ncbi:hypothetical protein CFC21_095203 [Triticum aestivum]|uniref:F-box domain-containing protein n=2 Tax=Triticum aestivum TaxID=4565 RepID=A0A9R1LPW7_WHEAT|nr:putative F-box protein At3g17480 [Triticum aestivum]KAF7092746.1 hypothetical protein CFC21_095203 [Triticum aestivum]
MEEKEGTFERNTKPRLDDHPGAMSASLLTDDLILEILSRLPARSLNQFKCVSVPWRDLITDPTNRRKLPQALAGFLYMAVSNNRRIHHHFASVYGAVAPFDPALHYLRPNKDEGITQVDACNGLLLYRRYKKNKATPWIEDACHFVVCNPATGRWVELPHPPQPQEPANSRNHTTGLAFDPVVSSHFHVLCFEYNFPGAYIKGVNIYSSRAGAWSRRDSGMVEKVILCSKCVYVGGMPYVIGNLKHINGEYVLVGVDMEGKVWKTIRVPYGRSFGTIGVSQGCLHYAIASVDDNNKILVSEIALWCLKDHDSKELVLKHTASLDKLMSMTGLVYQVAEIHPDCDTIFLVQLGGDTLVSYDMRHQKVGCILNLKKHSIHKFLPYVPLFSESLAGADGH